MTVASGKKTAADFWLKKGFSLSELIDCPFCGEEIPRADRDCFFCGGRITADPDRGAYTCRRASKTWRGIFLIGGVMALAGALSMLVSENNLPVGMLLSLTGLILFFLGRIGYWWCRQ